MLHAHLLRLLGGVGSLGTLKWMPPSTGFELVDNDIADIAVEGTCQITLETNGAVTTYPVADNPPRSYRVGPVSYLEQPVSGAGSGYEAKVSVLMSNTYMTVPAGALKVFGAPVVNLEYSSDWVRLDTAKMLVDLRAPYSGSGTSTIEIWGEIIVRPVTDTANMVGVPFYMRALRGSD